MGSPFSIVMMALGHGQHSFFTTKRFSIASNLFLNFSSFFH
jgi:hypothetical protein